MYSAYVVESKNKYILYFFFSNLFYFLSLNHNLLQLRELFNIVSLPKSRQETFFIILRHKQFLFLDQLIASNFFFFESTREVDPADSLCWGKSWEKFSYNSIILFIVR